jgi:transposase
MDGSNRGANAKQRAVSGGSEKRRRRSVLERRQIVEETLAPGASVARVARAHEVNANQVHYWRSLYRRGLLGGAVAATAALVPVTVTDSAAGMRCSAQPATRVAVGADALVHAAHGLAEPGAIHIQLRRARLRIEGQVDLAALRAVLEALGG